MATYIPSSTFYEAAAYLSNASSLSKISSGVKLELYGLFKYLTSSPTPSTTRPSIFDMTGRAKWDAWNNAGINYSDPGQAEHRYIEIAESLGWAEGEPPEDQHINEEDVDLDALDDGPENRGQASTSTAAPGIGGLGPAVSKAQLPEATEDLSIHGLAVDNDIAGLIALLDRNPDLNLNTHDEFGYTALHLAADRGNIDAVALLLEKGADVSFKDPDGFTAPELANIAGHQDIQQLLSQASTK